MSIILLISCSMCGKQMQEFSVDFDKKAPKSLREAVEQAARQERGWVIQQNGPYIDTYCSKKCAL